MWTLNKPEPVKLIIGILAADEQCLTAAGDRILSEFGASDLISDIWSFTQTDYYADQAGEHILRQFVTIDKLIDPGELAAIKHKTNEMEQTLAAQLDVGLRRPVNLDPGYIELSKLVLASTKNFSHRIYIGDNMYAEVTLTYSKGTWIDYRYTFADYKQGKYHDFLSKARERLLEQIRSV